MSRIHLIIPGLLSILVGTGCSGPGQTTSDARPDGSTSLFNDGRFLWVDASETRLRDLSNNTNQLLGEGGHVLYSSVSPDRSHVALAVKAGSESRLVLFSAESSQSTELHTGSASLEYTGSWSPDGSQLSFGYYEPTTANDRPALGAGDIKIISLADHARRRLGCSSSKAVISWPSSDEVVVRSSDNLYRVTASDCSTLQTTDIRRWRAITPSPNGQRLAYTFRELAFNNTTREYEPDSALFVVSVNGGEPVKIVGDRYRPRHANWSADGTEIAFDVRVDPDSEKRAISIYSLATEEAAYAFPPSANGPSMSHPVWNPNGQTLSYREDGSRLSIQTPGANFSQTVTVGDAQSYANRLVGWLSPTTVLVAETLDSIWMYDATNQALEFVGTGTGIPF
ncbi:MAG: hypothetical protein BMS9Abin05_0709 [Rhodothermia bacterium]|nr:MAG: hypothetical protein BMS9Abin05_0709 [Rhodothermia bacterium]